MAYIPVENVAQLEFVYNWAGQVCQNVLHYRIATGWDADKLQTLCTDAIAEWIAGPRLQVCTNLSLISVKATDLSTQIGPVHVSTVGLPSAGSLTPPSTTNNVALVVTKRTASRGRSFRGRIFHPGLANGDITNNIVLAARVSAVVAAWTTMLVLNVGAESADMVVVSRFQSNQPLIIGVSTLVTNLTSDGVVDSQRNRLPGRGS